MKKNNGGLAFPLMINKDAEQGSMEKWCNQGMTLRDYFAGQAIPIFDNESDYSVEELAKSCYQYADAMIAERNK